MKRIPELDGLRGLAALAVIAYHGNPQTETRLDELVSYGWLAVDLFFLLSGYLITAILLGGRPNQRFVASFYARRSLRIWPLYYLAIAAVGALAWLGAFPPLDAARLAAYATYTQELPLWASPWRGYGPLSHFWSLAVEEQFYLAWPAVVLFAGRRAVVPAAIGLIVTSVLARSAGPGTHHLLIGRCDALGYGAILAMILGPNPNGSRRLVPAFAAVAATALAVLAAARFLAPKSLDRPEIIILIADPLFFGVVGLVACLQGRPCLVPLHARPLAYLGTISYGLYIYHWPIMLAINHASAIGSPTIRLVLAMALTVAVAALSWHAFERPILGFKRRFEYRSVTEELSSGPVWDVSKIPTTAQGVSGFGA